MLYFSFSPKKKIFFIFMNSFLNHVLILFFFNQILPGVKVVIANPETKGMCADSHLGEVRHVSKLEDCELFIINFCLSFDRLKYCARFGFTI